MKKIAVIMSGHPRMVPQGRKMIDKVLGSIDGTCYEIFSLTWIDNEPKIGHYSGLDADTYQILSDLGDNNHFAEQIPILDELYQRFMESGAIPEPAEACINRDTFHRYSGQIWGFLLAMDRWRSRLGEFDIVVRSRWDRVIDPACIDILIGNGPSYLPTPREWLFTMDVSIWRGQVHLSGDVIYGTAENWLGLIPSTEVATLRSMAAMKKWCQDFIEKNPKEFFATNIDWFTSHWLWSTVLDGSNASITRFGTCYPILPVHSVIPPDMITIDSLQSPDTFSDELMVSDDPELEMSFMVHGIKQKYFSLLSQWCEANIGVRGKFWDTKPDDDGTVTWCFSSIVDARKFSELNGFPRL